MPMPACSGARAMGILQVGGVTVRGETATWAANHQNLWWSGRRATRCGTKLQPCNYIVKVFGSTPPADPTRASTPRGTGSFRSRDRWRHGAPPRSPSLRPGRKGALAPRGLTGRARRSPRRMRPAPGVAQPTTDTEATTTIPLIRAGAQCTHANVRAPGCGALGEEPVNCGWISWDRAARRSGPPSPGPDRVAPPHGRPGYGATPMRQLWPEPVADADPTGGWGGLGGRADKRVFAAIRGVADVVMAGAGTVTAEDYGPSRPSEAVRRARLARGQAAVPRIAVVSAALSISPDQRLFREASPDARPVVLTVEAADPERRRALAEVAEVHSAGETRVDWPRALAVLRDRLGARVVL